MRPSGRRWLGRFARSLPLPCDRLRIAGEIAPRQFGGGPAMTSPTLRSSAAGVKGFGRNEMSASTTPRWTIVFSV